MSTITLRRVRSNLAEIVAEVPLEYGSLLRHARAAFLILEPLIGAEAQEVFAALLLDGKHRLSAYVEVTRGTLTASLVHPREIYGPAVRMGAAALIVAHNHPSGDPEPSPEDIAVTERLRQAGEIMGIPLIDHLIIGAGSFTSLRERGLLR